jgi:hypothetical protein
MKTTTIVSLVLSASNVATAVKFGSGLDGWELAMGFNATAQPWDNIKLPSQVARAVAPKRQELKPRVPHIAGSKSVKMRYGPYTVPAPLL